MTKRMLIDDTQPEETRVVIVNGNKVEDVEFESSFRKQIKGNIYLAKVMRIEPSLQAAFVDYGGNKHGFLAFGEIHPDYYNVSEETLAEVEGNTPITVRVKVTWTHHTDGSLDSNDTANGVAARTAANAVITIPVTVTAQQHISGDTVGSSANP